MRWSFILFLAAGYVLLVAFAFLFADRLTFFPSRTLRASPLDRGLAYEDVSFRAADGTALHGWYVPGKGNGVVLMCHGNAGNVSHRLDWVEIFHGLGLSVFLFDYRGYGKSEGRPTIQGVCSDAEGAWRYLADVRGIAPDGVVLHGHSLGGAVAAWLAERFPPAGLILEGTFTTLADAGRTFFFFLPVRLIVGDAFDTLSCVTRLSCPVLVASSPDDEIVPGEHGRTLFAAAREPKWFLPMTGDHNTGFLHTGQIYVDGLRAFFIHVLPPKGQEMFPVKRREEHTLEGVPTQGGPDAP